MKTDDAIHSLQGFVPIYPELHRQRKVQDWNGSQTKLTKKSKPLPPLDVELSSQF